MGAQLKPDALASTEMDTAMFRWFALATFVLSLSISAVRRRQARQATGTIRRGEESRPLILGRIAVALPLFGGVVAYLANPQWMAWASLSLPLWTRWIGVVLGILAVPSVHWVLSNLGENVSETVLTKQVHCLVTVGPYRWVRHPLYMAGITLFLGIGLMAANWFILLWALIALVAVRLAVIPREEAHLEAKFGEEYRRYRTTTGSLLPLLPGLRGDQRAG
jgi:protein-S-isoprenylcysteine O-methyltransferase Ste14